MKDEMQRAETMREVLEQLEGRLAGRRVFRFMSDLGVTDISCEQFFSDIRRTAFLIEDTGLSGKHIGLMGRNSYWWMVCLCAVFWSGSVAVLLDRELDEEELKERVGRVEAEALFFERAPEVEERCRALEERVKILSFEKVRETCRSGRESKKKVRKRGEHLGCIFFTSGTTATSKAVMMSEHGLSAGICHNINDKKSHSILAVLPFHHLSGFSSSLNALFLGAEVCIGEEQKYFYQYLKELQPDYVFIVPSMLRMLARKIKNGGPNGRLLGWNLHLLNCGGADFRPEFLRIFLEHDITVLQGYGASEAGAIGFLWEMTEERPDTIGKPPAGLDVKIAGGELYLRSESLMMGYYDDEEGTGKVLREGWYATGDLCRMDEEGYLYLTGRKKNLIILSNGENISPEAIEKKLYRWEEIGEALVKAEGDLIAVSVFPRYPAECTAKEAEQIRQKIREEIAEYNRSVPVYSQIQVIHFLEEPIDKTSMGKLIRYGKG